MKLFKIFGVTLAASLFLAGCGGGTSLTGSSGGGSGGGSTVAAVNASASAASIAADGSTTSTITATVLDATNVAITGVTVGFAASAGGVVTVVNGTTDASGRATATVAAAAGAAVGTAVTVKATAGTASGSVIVTVVQIQQTLALSTSAPQIPSDSSKGATITALMRDANNNVLPGVAVNFSPDSGAITKTQTVPGAAATPPVVAGTTDANGVAAAVLTAGNDQTNRTITVTVSAGTAPPVTIQVSVTGTLLALSGQASLVAGNSSVYTALLTDASGSGIAGKTVTFSSAKGNTLSAMTATTDAGGHATVTLTATVAGSDTLTAAALGLTATQTVVVSSESFTITSPTSGQLIPLDTVPPTNTPVFVTVLWKSSGNPKVGAPVTLSSTRGSILSATAPYAVLANPTVNTDGTGTATVAIASSLAGPAIISASGAGVSAQVPVTFVAQTPASIAVQASPATIPINGQSTVSAIVRDSQNNLVQGATVDFNLTVDPTGGSLSTASATTDVQGRAQTIYTASATTSAANGITVTASVPGTAVTNSTQLSVGGQTVFLSLGTGNKISAPNTAQYEQDWAVQALDSHGAALSGAPVTATVLPLYYYKGFRTWSGTFWSTVNSIPACPFGALCTDFTKYGGGGTPPSPAYVFVPNGTQCPNEDIGWTGIYVASEDYNQNGKLDPGNVASVQPSTGGLTDSTGTLLLHVTWPQDHAYYVGVRLEVTATVQGTQHSTSADFLLPGLATDFNQQTTAPPGPFSPYGFENSSVNDCSNPK